jgi:hypothetical protein
MKTYTVTYTKAIKETATINVQAPNKELALIAAKHYCYTGDNFRDAVETNETYIHPRQQR